jgi:hypothetical protein
MDPRHSILPALLGTGLGLWLSGCIVSPQPEPPTIQPDRVWIELTSTNPDDPEAEFDTAVIHGEEGAVSPGGATLRVVDLDLAEEPRDATVEADGSFSVALGGRPGHVFRLRAEAHGLWSSPVDLVAPEESGETLPPDVPLADCLFVRAPEPLAFGAVIVGDIVASTVALENRCGEPARIESVRLRIGAGQAATCDEDYQSCLAEGAPDTECSPAYDSCSESCRLRLEECLAEGTSDTCEIEHTACQDECTATLQACREQACADLYGGCDEIPFEQPQGFTVLHGTLPMAVPDGAARSIIVTFAPLEPGPAEDALIIEVGSPEASEGGERRTVTLTGTGIDG